MVTTTTRRRVWTLLLVTALVAGPWTARSVSAMTLSVQVDTAQPVDPGASSIQVTIRADSELTLGATDITLNWDLDGIQVDSVSSPLTLFMSNIDNPARQVRTASAAGSAGDVVAAGDPLITFSITANDPGVYTLFITDGDGVPPDDLAGPVPPIPPVSIAYTPVSGMLQVGPLPQVVPLLSGPGKAALAIGMLVLAGLLQRRWPS